MGTDGCGWGAKFVFIEYGHIISNQNQHINYLLHFKLLIRALIRSSGGTRGQL